MTADLTLAPADADRIRAEAAAARAAFDSGRTKPLAWRLKQLAGIEGLIIERERELAEALAADLGKSADEAWITELSVVKSEARHAIQHLRQWLKPRPVAVNRALLPARAWTMLEPLGTVLIIGPWNYPAQLVLAPLIGALAAGNSAVVKPSELAPATSALLAELLPNFVDRDAVRIVEGGAAETSALLAERWDHIFYTGGGRVARIVARAAAEHLTPTVLELGGKSPAFVDASTDLRTAARRIAWAKFTNAGQTCVAPDYVLVTPDARDELLRELTTAVRHFYGEHPLRNPDYGRIISRGHFDRLEALLADGHVICGGAVDADRLRIAPTVLTDVDPEAAVMRDEIFGPILPVLEVPDAAAATAFIRARPKPLALYTFTEHARVRRHFERDTSSGTLVHGYALAQLANTELPFGGVGDSGMGKYHGEASVRVFSHEKSVSSKPMRPDTLALTYPPLNEVRRRLVRGVM